MLLSIVLLLTELLRIAYFWLELIIEVVLYSCEREGGKTVLGRNSSLNKGKNTEIMADEKNTGKLF